jgi:hypothetical protein
VLGDHDGRFRAFRERVGEKMTVSNKECALRPWLFFSLSLVPFAAGPTHLRGKPVPRMRCTHGIFTVAQPCRSTAIANSAMVPPAR